MKLVWYDFITLIWTGVGSEAYVRWYWGLVDVIAGAEVWMFKGGM